VYTMCGEGFSGYARGLYASVERHPLVTPLQESFSALLRGRVRVGIVRENLATEHGVWRNW
jgi:hypothetical protein